MYLHFQSVQALIKEKQKIKARESVAPHKPLVKGSMPIFPKALQTVAIIDTPWHILWNVNAIYLQGMVPKVISLKKKWSLLKPDA